MYLHGAALFSLVCTCARVCDTRRVFLCRRHASRWRCPSMPRGVSIFNHPTISAHSAPIFVIFSLTTMASNRSAFVPITKSRPTAAVSSAPRDNKRFKPTVDAVGADRTEVLEWGRAMLEHLDRDRTAALQERELNVLVRERDVTAREEAIAAREEELDERQEEIDYTQSQLSCVDQNIVRERHTQLQEREDSIAAREAALASAISLFTSTLASIAARPASPSYRPVTPPTHL